MTTTESQKSFAIAFLHIFLPRLVLEVFGGGGAIWGFSEAIGFRTPETVYFWRPAALTVGAIFFVRWLNQIRDHCVEMYTVSPHSKVDEKTSLMGGSSEMASYESEGDIAQTP
mmetsp:Transcript_12948/g.16916  ORF Transcript_12948/g.16916 Transcript_12948/m.16916 type:complete len:113 (-) Transcript_12948:196-534(-)